MSDPGVFIAGLVVTLIVGCAIALLVYAAVLDGRYDDERRTTELRAADRTVAERDELAERRASDTLVAA